MGLPASCAWSWVCATHRNSEACGACTYPVPNIPLNSIKPLWLPATHEIANDILCRSLQPRCLRAVSDCRPRSVQLRRLRGAAYLPVLKRFEDGSVRFRYMTLHKFRYYSIALRDRFRPPVLLSHGQPSILKRGKFPFLLVGHWSLR